MAQDDGKAPDGAGGTGPRPSHGATVVTGGVPPREAPAASALRPRIVLPLLAGIAVAGSQMFIVSPLLPDIARDLGQSISSLGLAVSGGSLGTAVMAALSVPVLDRFPRVGVLTGALAFLAAMIALVAASTSFAVFAVAFALAGAAVGVLLPTTYALAADISAEHERTRLLGLVLLGWSLSFFLQPVASEFGDVLGWRGAFALIAGVALLTALADLTLPRRAPAGTGIGFSAYGAALAIPAVKPLLGACVAFMAAFYGVYPYWGAAFRAAHGGDASAASVLAVAYGAGFMISGLIVSRWLARYSTWVVLIGAVLCLVATYSVLGRAIADERSIIAWAFGLGLVNNAGLSSLIGSLASLSNERRGSLMAIYSAVTYVGFTVGAAAMGPVFERYGIGVNGAVSASILVMGLLSAIIARRASLRR
ncbi:MAG: MFS transporter [Hyphomicrobiaceae bacterium]